MRVLLGLACLGIILASPGLWPLGVVALVVMLIFYSVIALFWKRLEKVWNSRLTLTLDTLFFIVAVSYQPENGFWVGAFFAFYLLLSAALLHQWHEVIAVVVVTIGYLSLVRPVLTDALRPTILLLGMFACVLVLQKRTLLDRLSQFSRQVVMFRGEAEAARESERQRIAADFHDGPLQSFISFQMRLEIVKKMLARDHEAGIEELRQLQELCRAQVSELRSYVRSMRPLDFDGAGLVASIVRIIQAFQRDSGISVTFSGGDDPDLEDAEASSEILQVVREALHNVQKHSNASRVDVSIKRRDGRIEILIDDDGRGFPFSGDYTLDELELLRVGPASIKRRVRSLNGELSLASRPGSGSRLEIRLPS